MSKIDPKILELANKITAKRAKTVIDHIIKHGSISTEELKDVYGYDHPPRAARDVRECGIPLETFKVTDKHGRRIGAYRFGDPSKIEGHKLGGRQTFSKNLKQTLIDMFGERCAISGINYKSRYLQIDHRIPYEVAGDDVAEESDPEKFMLLSGTAQRQKSWECEQCPNLRGAKSKAVCSSCYWAYPTSYTHAATVPIRLLNIGFSGQDADIYDHLNEESNRTGIPIQQLVIQRLKP
ncbi:TPA: hypothetical protein NKP54_004038 [Vibrio parahaemolyticus]|uniref:helix-turn-helix domain-containing protein n=1 Tax=Vibrio vulnificus TaxID=672 RepID=UPI001FAE7DDE|nr:helix-turn-helix domain-containing protein [Vibrio vulnificus]MCJ0814285.1 helix-turn-helix domain-containing protein [Vibrio vulnificus]HCH1007099.1 hypothetical protein [Vibrio parahaemolyticus]